MSKRKQNTPAEQAPEQEEEVLQAEEVVPVMCAFIGDGHDDPSEIDVFGMHFPHKQGVDVSELTHEQITKLRGNSHFVFQDDEE